MACAPLRSPSLSAGSSTSAERSQCPRRCRRRASEQRALVARSVHALCDLLKSAALPSPTSSHYITRRNKLATFHLVHRHLSSTTTPNASETCRAQGTLSRLAIERDKDGSLSQQDTGFVAAVRGGRCTRACFMHFERGLSRRESSRGEPERPCRFTCSLALMGASCSSTKLLRK